MTKIITFLLLFCAISVTAQKGKLNKAKKNVKETSELTADDVDWGDDDDDGHKRTGSGGLDFGFDEDLSIEGYVVVGLIYGTVGTFIGRAEHTDLNLYPYYKGNPGDYVGFTETDADTTFTTNNLYEYKLSDLRASINYFTAGSVNGGQADVNFRFFYLMGLEASYNYYYEDIIGETVTLDAVSVMLNYYRVRTKNVVAWWGAGYTYMGADVNEGGFAYQLGMDVFAVKPTSFRALWKRSRIGDNRMDELQLQAKYHVNRSAFYMGWHYNKIAGIGVNGFSLGYQYIIN